MSQFEKFWTCATCGGLFASLIDRDVHSAQEHKSEPGATMTAPRSSPAAEGIAACPVCGSPPYILPLHPDNDEFRVECSLDGHFNCLIGPAKTTGAEAISARNAVAALRRERDDARKALKECRDMLAQVGSYGAERVQSGRHRKGNAKAASALSVLDGIIQRADAALRGDEKR